MINPNKTDAQLHTKYIGDSVYASFDPDTNTFCVFLNNGERDTPLHITRKSPIILERSEARALADYLHTYVD